MHPERVRAQFEGAAVFGASLALMGEITAAHGRIQQSNYHDYPVARIGEAPYERWRAHRFDLSAERMKALLAPEGSYLDTIELAARWSVLPALHARVKSAIAVGGLALCHFSHAYEQGSCAYFSFGGSAEREEDARSAYNRAWEGAMTAALELGATITHHHGTGQARARWVADEMGGWMAVWRAARRALDPAGIMNPRALGGVR